MKSKFLIANKYIPLVIKFYSSREIAGFHSNTDLVTAVKGAAVIIFFVGVPTF